MSVEIVSGYRPGAIGAITALHARYYGKHWGFGLYFESVVATEVAAFLSRLDPATDCIWLALSGDDIVGSIVVDGGEPEAKALGAHIRVFIVDETLRGKGVGRVLLQQAVDFCRQQKYARVYLWTFAGLDAARHLYEKSGFRLVEQIEGEQWGKRVLEQRFLLELGSLFQNEGIRPEGLDPP